MKKVILHISFDFPDSEGRYKTPAIKRLIENNNLFNHIIISINRVNLPFEERIDERNGIYEFRLFYLKYGVFLNFFLKRAAKKIRKHLNLDFDLIHCHKLTFEGVIGYHLANLTNKKFVITIRGDTDFKVINYKRGSWGLYRKILAKSHYIFALAPWIGKKINFLFKENFFIESLPNISNVESWKSNSLLLESDYFVTIFMFENKNHIRKNFKRTLLAFRELHKKYDNLKLLVIGDGSDRKIIENLLRRYTVDHFVFLEGYKNSCEIKRYLSNAISLILPSYPETFGLVFLEALSAGIPILHAKNSGVDGYFSESVSFRVHYKSKDDILKGMEKMFICQKEYKENVRFLLDSDEFKIFETKRIVEQYSTAINKILLNKN